MNMRHRVVNVFVVAWLVALYVVTKVGGCENFDFDRGKYILANIRRSKPTMSDLTFWISLSLNLRTKSKD